MPLQKIKVGWIPAHPAYGAVSMRRYWQALMDSRQTGDRYQIQSVISPADGEAPSGIVGKATRYLQRNIAYPQLVRRSLQGDIAHVLDHSWADMLTAVPKDVPKVVTVHDLIPLRFPGELTAAQLQRFLSWVSNVNQADAVIADSQYTKDEMVDLLGTPRELISVVPCGVKMPEEDGRGSPLPGLRRNPNSFLVGSIGSTIARKNLSILPAALAKSATLTQKRITLVRVGAPLASSLANDIKSALGEDGLVELGYLSDSDVIQFYASIDAVVIPSFYEGFGLPVIEGMAARIPVIAADATSLPEVGGDVALYFDPHSPEALAAVLARVANDGFPERQIEAGYQRAKAMSWRSCLEGIYAVYDSLPVKNRVG